jgi:hypothetical protein
MVQVLKKGTVMVREDPRESFVAAPASSGQVLQTASRPYNVASPPKNKSLLKFFFR